MHLKDLATWLFSAIILVPCFAKAESYERLRFETIFNLPLVHSLVFDETRGDLIVAVDGHLLQWSLEPFRLVNQVELSIIPNEMSIGPDRKLYAVGLGWDSQNFSSIGSLASVFARNTTNPENIELQISSSSRGISEYSSLSFDSQGTPVWASASNFTASPIPSTSDFAAGVSVDYPQIRFKCGGASQLSIFEISGQDLFLVSAAGIPALELGIVSWEGSSKGSGECFFAEEKLRSGRQAQTFNGLIHQVIDIADTPFADDGGKKAVLVLDPSTSQLKMFRIEPFADSYFISRQGVLEFDVAPHMLKDDRGSTLTNLVADRHGKEILVSSNTSRGVVRVRFDGESLRSKGRFTMGAAVQDLEMTDDGAFAAMVTGNETFGGDWRIVLMAQPSELADWAQIPPSFPSVRKLQEMLQAKGLNAGFPDGILGPQTTDALMEYWQRRDPSIIAPENEKLESAIFSSFPSLMFEETLFQDN